MDSPKDIGRTEEAIEAAETATFHAANVCRAHLGDSGDSQIVLDALVDAANAVRKVTGGRELSVRAYGHFEHHGEALVHPAGGALKRLGSNR